MLKLLRVNRYRCFVLLVISLSVSVTIWNINRLKTTIRLMGTDKSTDQENVAGSIIKFKIDQSVEIKKNVISISSNAAQALSFEGLNMTALMYKVRSSPECLEVAADPKSYWRSQQFHGSLNTTEVDIARMVTAFKCGLLYKEFLSTPPIDKLYPFEKFYLSEPPLIDVKDISNENLSICTPCNSSLAFKVGETVAFKIEMRDGRGKPKLKGGDQIRVWFEDYSNNAKMAANVKDFNNGTYLASAPLPWAGELRLRVALAYPREYLRAVLYLHQVLKTFRPIAAVYSKALLSEAAPCYHTQVVPAFGSSELCNLTDINGAPWFCGHPIKSQLSCSDFEGTIVIGETTIYPITDAEREILERSCREPRIRNFPVKFDLKVESGHSTVTPELPCNKVLPQSTWVPEAPTGYLYNGTWFPLSCHFSKPDYSVCFRNKQVLIFGDSNGRSHYEQIHIVSGCTAIKKALTKKWHKPLLCVHKKNNFTVRWDPHTNPFMNGHELATLDSLIPTANAIDEISSHGQYLIILNHFYHLTTSHISSVDLMFRHIKAALVRLFKRNPNVQVVLQGPHIAWFGWPEHYAAGDMLGPHIIDLEREIFDDIKDKVVFISPWDMTVAVANWDYHPSVNKNIFHVIVGFMCGR